MKMLRKPISILLSVIMVVSLFTVVPFTANAVDNSQVKETLTGYTLNDYTVMIRPVGTSSYSLCIESNGSGSGQHDLQLYDIGDSSRLYLEKADDESYYIHFFDGANTFSKSRKVLDVKSGSGGVVYINDPSGSNSQKWKLYLLNDGSYWFQNVGSGMYWKRQNNNYEEGNKVVQRDEPDKWEVSLVAQGDYRTDNVPATARLWIIWE